MGLWELRLFFLAIIGFEMAVGLLVVMRRCEMDMWIMMAVVVALELFIGWMMIRASG